ncbi:hypothetical protein CRG98_045221 [Punica granatum]|uniref:Uncharacterized protein n=1 Tax=Punica granatum TaxID=22663 RepID=A0A2I0HRP1_PUNGR|nr:hypothetical protein CRG98_045221 [Punica granatum]
MVMRAKDKRDVTAKGKGEEGVEGGIGDERWRRQRRKGVVFVSVCVGSKEEKEMKKMVACGSRSSDVCFRLCKVRPKIKPHQHSIQFLKKY